MAMAENEKGDTASSKEGESWGTLEELLLACAVSRHGTESWDSIAMEVQKRATTRNRNGRRSNDESEKYDNFLNVFTPHSCEKRYNALKRRFNVAGDGERDDSPAGGDSELREKLPLIVDELKKLRVEELRREMERHDDSIESLQLKVKKLQEERERSSLKAEPLDGVADLDRNDAGAERSGGAPAGSSPEVADKSISGDRSDEPEDRSFNESNSTSHKGERKSNQRREPDENRKSEPDPVRPAADCSSSPGGVVDGGEMVGEEKVVGRTSPPGRLGNSGELKESVSESKREGKDSEAKQSSDVQSSASLSRKRRRGWRRSDGVGVGSSGDEMEAEELSPANRRMDVKSQPLIKFLEILRSHKHGPVFQRRLPSQDTEKYRSLTRQHMDLDTVQTKLERGVYCDSHSRFYRDILLVFTNAILFFCKSSTEHMAARDLRRVVLKEVMAQRAPPRPKPAQPIKPDLEAQILDPVVKKPRSSTNIVVCRRRTNASAMKPSSLSSELNTAKAKEEEVEKADKLVKDEPKKMKRSNLGGRSVATTTTATTSNNNGGSGNKKGKGAVQQGESNNSNNASANNKDGSSDEEEQPINKRRKQLVSSRKQGVVNFLKRMTQNSPSKEAAAAKGEAAEVKEEEAAKKMGVSKKKVVGPGKKSEGDDGAGKRRVSGRKQAKDEEEVAVKRGSGRPALRKAAAGGGAPESGRQKRRRDGEEVGGGSGKSTIATAAATTNAKKKSRK